MNEENRSRGSTQQLTKINVDNPLFCPHDLTKSQDFRDDLPTLLGGHFKNSPAANSDINIECKTSKVRAFNCIDEDKVKSKSNPSKGQYFFINKAVLVQKCNHGKGELEVLRSI